MCGIVGFTGGPRPDILRTMCRSLIHRGPDGEGYYEGEGVHIGMRRLAIVDLETGDQPICNEDATIWVVFNGEIYNHLELRADLLADGHVFRSHHSDTETIVHLYEEYGDLWPKKGGVNGMFGVALWDARRRRLLLYRDRIGKKPLYWSLKNGQLIFGSEIKAVLVHPDVSRQLDYQALYHYFSLKNCSAPATAYQDIRQLLPGHYLVWQDGQVQEAPYWRLDFSRPLLDITPAEAAKHLSSLLDDAVRLRMQCDVPYGAYLSGGVDSSSVVALMCRHQTQPVITFCLGYDDSPEGQFAGKSLDIRYARLMSSRLHTRHHEYIMSASEFAERLPDILQAFDEPFSGTISTYFLSILIHRHVKVALSGDGADELFGSYLAHRLAWPIYYYLNLQKQGKTDLVSLEDHERQLLEPFASNSQFNFLKSIASPEQADWRMRLAVFDEGEKRKLLSPDFLREVGMEDSKNLYQDLLAQATATDPLNITLEVDQRELLPNQCLPFVDRLSMAHSIEVRCPYLDYRIIEFASRLPGMYKINNGSIKYIHKKAMENLLPNDLLERPKEGFVQPIYSWMHTKLKDWVESTIDSLPPAVFNMEYVQNLKRAFKAAEPGLDAKIWNLVCFQIWWQKVLGKSHPTLGGFNVFPKRARKIRENCYPI